jgi:solute carrier family 35 protein
MLLMLSMSPEELALVREFPHWDKAPFVLAFLLASVMGSVLNYSTFLCTALNSALTTTVVGCLKNVLTTYLGMLLLTDYVFSWSNFLGLNLSIVGSLVYSSYEFREKADVRRPCAPLHACCMASTSTFMGPRRVAMSPCLNHLAMNLGGRTTGLWMASSD